MYIIAEDFSLAKTSNNGASGDASALVGSLGSREAFEEHTVRLCIAGEEAKLKRESKSRRKVTRRFWRVCVPIIGVLFGWFA